MVRGKMIAGGTEKQIGMRKGYPLERPLLATQLRKLDHDVDE